MKKQTKKIFDKQTSTKFDIIPVKEEETIINKENLETILCDFGEWLLEQGLERYDGHDRWLKLYRTEDSPLKMNKVYETRQLVDIWRKHND